MNKIIGIVAAVFIVLAGGGYYIGTKLAGGNSATLVNSAPGYKEFNIVMQDNRYNPSQITVNQGDRVVLNLSNRDSVAHGVDLPQFGARLPGGHLQPGTSARLDFIASEKGATDAATCGGGPGKQTDDHGEQFIVNVV